MKNIRLLGFLTMVAIAGCDSDGIVRPPPTTVSVFDAASNLETIGLLREETLLTQLGYANGTRESFDSGQYDFHLETRRPSSNFSDRRLSISETLSADLDYTFVVTAPGGEPEILVTSTEELPEDTGTVRWSVIHGHAGLGDVDIYVEPADTDLSQATSRGRVSYGDAQTFEFAMGFVRLFLTSPGDPSDVIFESTDQVLPLNIGEVLVISDPGNEGTSDILVSSVNVNTLRLGQEGQQSSLRVINLTEDRQARDVYLDDTATTPLFPALGFGTLLPYSTADPSQHVIITTPVDNPGTQEGSVGWFGTRSRLFTVMLTGDASTFVTHTVILEDKRSVVGQSTLRIFSGATLFGRVLVFLVEPGTDITTANALLELPAPGSSPRLPILPGEYEIYVRDLSTDTVLAGPELVTMSDGGVYTMILANSSDGNTVDLLLTDDFTP